MRHKGSRLIHDTLCLVMVSPISALRLPGPHSCTSQDWLSLHHGSEGTESHSLPSDSIDRAITTGLKVSATRIWDGHTIHRLRMSVVVPISVWVCIRARDRIVRCGGELFNCASRTATRERPRLAMGLVHCRVIGCCHRTRVLAASYAIGINSTIRISKMVLVVGGVALANRAIVWVPMKVLRIPWVPAGDMSVKVVGHGISTGLVGVGSNSCLLRAGCRERVSQVAEPLTQCQVVSYGASRKS